MKKAEATLIAWLVVIGIIVYVFVWFHEKIGWLGIGIIGVILIGIYIFRIVSEIQKEQDQQKGDAIMEPTQSKEVIREAQKSIPYPAAFREIAVAIRKDIRAHRKEGKDSKKLLTQLYRWAVIENFFCFIIWTKILTESILHQTAKSCIKGISFSYEDIGYEQLGLLNKTDIKWLVEAFGEPTKHSNAKEANVGQWKQAVAIFNEAKKRDEKYYWKSAGLDGPP